MKRKIAAIFAADVAGYSRLVAEDEEETVRRLASYRAVTDDFIIKAGGRIFNTAGDAVLAEFPSAVEAVRCAIDIQESLRTRNLAYPLSRHMSFRIGITIGDVIERDGDLLGDGVNIAARLEGLAAAGGICVSRAVHEQVANKLSVQFSDIGEQLVKNIATPVHAYMVATRDENGRVVTLPQKAPVKSGATNSQRAGIAAAVVAVVVALGGTAFLLLGRGGPQAGVAVSPDAGATLRSGSTAPPSVREAAELIPESVPLVSNRTRASIRNDYLAAPDHKAIAIASGHFAFITGQADEETARKVALDQCKARAASATAKVSAHSLRACELYASGTTVVYTRGRPPMPAPPWLVRDALVEKPLDPKVIPLLSETERTSVAKSYAVMKAPKAIAISPSGGWWSYTVQESIDEAARRALEACGFSAGVPCLILAVDNVFVLPVPATMQVTGFFFPSSGMVAKAMRGDLSNRLANGSGGWRAVAVGANGHPGVMLKAENEQAAIEGALGDCAKFDTACRVIAIGPFSVRPN